MSTTFGDMIDRIEDELKRPDLSSQIALAIKSAIKHHEMARFWFNETRASISTVDGQEYYTLPSNLIEIDKATLSVSSAVKYALIPSTWDELEEMQTNTSIKGRPTRFAAYGDEMRLYPIPDDAYSIDLAYAKELDELSATSDTNAWTTYGEQLIRARAKALLLLDVIRGPESQAEASAQKVIEQEALDRLRELSNRKRATGRIKPRW